jgi:hypothetical protein
LTTTTQRERLLLRLAEGDVDGELGRALERMRKFFFRSWAALDELDLSPGADPSKLKLWREAPPHSPESRKVADHDRALDTLAFWLGLSGASPED